MASYTGTTDATGKLSIAVVGTCTVGNAPTADYAAAPTQAGVVVAAGTHVSLTFQVTAQPAAYAWVCTDSHGGM